MFPLNCCRIENLHEGKYHVFYVSGCASVSDEDLIAKILELQNVSSGQWTVEWLDELPLGIIPINWQGV